jgi:aspartate/methionine/tyrosine aminotransferase
VAFSFLSTSMAAISTRSAKRLSHLDPNGTVFSYYTALANKHQAINLGQGFPTLPVQDFIRKAAINAISHEGLGHQYTRSEGHPRLVKGIDSLLSSINVLC